jgi:anti-sigma regulatory factor (Ser/Thr protein kinase)
MAVIKLPARISDNFGDGLNNFFRIMEKIRSHNLHEPVELDFTPCAFLTPFFLLPLTLLITEERKHRVITIINNSKNNGCKSYLENIHFENGLQPESISAKNYEAVFNKYLTKTYIPLINFPASRELNNTQVRDSFLSVINNLLVKQLDLKGQFITGIMYLIDEAINNIVDHSKEDRGFIFAQYFRDKNFLDVCIADAGISILGSYKQNNIPGVDTDKSAIQNAAVGKSTKDRPPAESRGFGISTSKKMLADGLKGKYFLYSGNAFLIKTIVKEEIVEIPDKLNWEGTIVALRIPYAGNIDFEASKYYD